MLNVVGAIIVNADVSKPNRHWPHTGYSNDNKDLIVGSLAHSSTICNTITHPAAGSKRWPGGEVVGNDLTNGLVLAGGDLQHADT